MVAPHTPDTRGVNQVNTKLKSPICAACIYHLPIAGWSNPNEFGKTCRKTSEIIAQPMMNRSKWRRKGHTQLIIFSPEPCILGQ